MNKAPNLEFFPVDRLIPCAQNARKHSKQQVDQIARSIKNFGFLNPVLIDSKGNVIAGHGRLSAAKILGLSQIPAIRFDHLSETEKRAYMLADNKLTENAGWDERLLKVELAYLTNIDLDFDVELTGFTTGEIDILLQPEEPSALEAPLPPPPTIPVSKLGDIWHLGPHRIICGDCRKSDVLKLLMRDEKAKMVITDPPYNVRIDGHARGKGKSKHTEFVMASGEMDANEFIQFLSTSLGKLADHSVDGSLHYIYMDWRHTLEILTAARDVYASQHNLCVWVKSNGGMGSHYRSQHELVFVFKLGQSSHINNIELGQYGRYRTNVWNYPGVNSFGADRHEALTMHPTVKPMQMIADAILDASKRNDIVLDGFLGSGTTLIAAEKTGRVCYGVEIDPRYVDVTLQRWMALTGEQPVLGETKETFNDVAATRQQGQTSENDHA